MQPAALTLTRIIRALRARRCSPPGPIRALLIQRWGPGPITCPEAEVDLREGGAYRIANRDADGSITWISGRFETVRAPEELVYTWSVNIVLPGGPTLVRVSFRPHPRAPS